MSAELAVILIAQAAEPVSRALERLIGQSLPRERFEVSIVDRSGDAALERAISPFRPQLRFSVLRQGSASLAASGNLAIFGASAPVLAFLDPAFAIGPGYLAAHIAAHRRIADDDHAVIGAFRATPDPQLSIERYAADHWPRLFSFGWRQLEEHAGTDGWGAGISVKRSFAVRQGLFQPKGRPWEAEIDLPFQLRGRPYVPAFEPGAVAELAGPIGFDDFLRRAFWLGLYDKFHRRTADKRLVARIGAPDVWASRLVLRTTNSGAILDRARRLAEWAPERGAGESRFERLASRHAWHAAFWLRYRQGLAEAVRLRDRMR